MAEKRDVTKSEKILESLISTHMQLKEQIFNTTSILLVVTSLIFSIISGFFIKDFNSFGILIKIAGFVLIISLLVTLILSLLSILPKLKHKTPGTEYYFMDVFRKFRTKQDYLKRLEKIEKSDEKTIKFFIDEYYELGEKVLLPGFKKIRLAIQVLIFGLAVSTALVILSLILSLV